MRLVINIPDEDYNIILANAEFYKEKHWGAAEVWDAIVGGTPLPKGHGDLIDRNTITVEEDVYFQNYIIHAPTIIEADKEKEE